MKLYDDIKRARNRSVPLVLVAVDPADQKALVANLVETINGDGAKYRWDFADGLVPLCEAATDFLEQVRARQEQHLNDPDVKPPPFDPNDTATANPAGAVVISTHLPPESVVFIENAHKFIDNVGFVQSVLNARDKLKTDHRMLVLLAPSIQLPVELQGSVVVYDEPLPDDNQAREIISEVMESAEMDGGIPDGAVAAVQGLPAFQIEQLTALSLTPDGLDVDRLWEAKKKQVESTQGLSVYRGGDKFDCLAGLEPPKNHIRRVGSGRAGCNAIVWLDEGGDQLSGMDDMTGITKDYHGQLLQYMEDTDARGFILFGQPGTGKSQICKCAGPELNVPTIRIDMGAMKGSLVGQSEQAFRNALKVVYAMSGGKALFLMTTNEMEPLSPQLQSRFSKGVYFFDMLSADERLGAWGIHRARFDLMADETWKEVADEGWVGRDIRNCCESAWDMEITIKEASVMIVPAAMASPKDIERRQELAHCRYLDASRPGVYKRAITRESAQRSVRV